MRILFSFILIFTIVSCQEANDSKKYEPNLVFNKGQQDSMTYALIRYMGKLPRHANHTNKFDSKFDSAYQQIAQKHILLAIHQDKNQFYFMYARLAPSLVEKYVAVAGRIEVMNGEMVSYNELFRTWKKPMEELKPLAFKLFNEMVQGKELSKYYPENSGNEYIIEFPSKEVYFDTLSRTWHRKGSANHNPLEEQ